LHEDSVMNRLWNVTASSSGMAAAAAIQPFG